jgi:hypothetical protein
LSCHNFWLLTPEIVLVNRGEYLRGWESPLSRLFLEVGLGRILWSKKYTQLTKIAVMRISESDSIGRQVLGKSSVCRIRIAVALVVCGVSLDHSAHKHRGNRQHQKRLTI